MSDERVIPGYNSTFNLAKHIARYNLALPYCDNGKVLDFACGTGYGSKIISMVASEVVGWDKDRDTIDYALANFGGKKISYYQVDIEEPIKVHEVKGADKYGVVICFETLEHLKNPAEAMQKLSEILTMGGMFIASVPLNEKPGQNEHHLHTYTLDEARKLFSGFEMVRETIQAELSFYPAEYADEFPDERVYYIFVGIKNS